MNEKIEQLIIERIENLQKLIIQPDTKNIDYIRGQIWAYKSVIDLKNEVKRKGVY